LSESPRARVRAQVLDAVIAHARATYPAECCGLLLGTDFRGPDPVGHDLLVEEARPARNISDHPITRFVIDPADHFEAMREARRRGLDVVGFYHSHPRSAAQPSETDQAEAGYPDHLCLIVSLASEPPDIRSFRLVDGSLRTLGLVTVG
jgi:proteasome lid subunit RPN8/RPN11